MLHINYKCLIKSLKKTTMVLVWFLGNFGNSKIWHKNDNLYFFVNTNILTEVAKKAKNNKIAWLNKEIKKLLNSLLGLKQ